MSLRLVLGLLSAAVWMMGQDPPVRMIGDQDHSMHEGMDMGMDPLRMFLMQQGSGTSLNPMSSPMYMVNRPWGGWNIMLHGLGFLADTQQSGPRGSDKLFSPNWLMVAGDRGLAGGRIQIRTMFSLEPATVTQRRYPELFQTGETAYGRPLIDAQHPHELFMELAVQYVRPLGEKTLLDLYFAPVGEPALGPGGFPHRASALALPVAPISHHWQDSTHIADEVVTAGVKHGMFRLEASGFHGQEPDENRWNIDHGGMDSWSARLWVEPGKNWAAQVSGGRLKNPEVSEPGDVVRTTASIAYNRPLAGGNWVSTVAWGRNHKTATGGNTNSWLAESLVRFREWNTITGRVEVADKDELFAGEHAGVYRIQAYTVGYLREFPLIPWLRTGLGASFSWYGVPSALDPVYGSRPVGGMVFLRVMPTGDMGN